MKKILILILSMCVCLSTLSGCSGETITSSELESSEMEETSSTPEPTATPRPTPAPEPTEAPVSMKSVEFRGVKLSVPNDWTTTENTDNIVFVTSYDDASLLSLNISEFNSEIDMTNSTFRDGYILGISESDGYEAVSTDDITINGHKGFEHHFLMVSSGQQLDTTFYGVVKGKKLVGFMFGMINTAYDDTKKQFESDIAAILESVDLSDLDAENVGKPNDESSSSAVKESSRASETKNTTTMGERNALKKAKNYLSFMPFSHSGLVDQLEFEGYTTDEAIYGADNCGADWNEQAAKKAQSYIDMMEFSRQGLIDQLIFEGFTEDQAEYGVTAIGY